VMRRLVVAAASATVQRLAPYSVRFSASFSAVAAVALITATRASTAVGVAGPVSRSTTVCRFRRVPAQDWAGLQLAAPAET